MADVAYYKAKIAECLRLVESNTDPLYRDVYRAMADEFTEKLVALSRGAADGNVPPAPPSPLLHQVAPPGGVSGSPVSAGSGGMGARLTAGRGHGQQGDRRRRRRGPGMVLRPA